MWKNTGSVEIKGSCNHYIDFEVACDQVGRWRYTRFYGCPERYRRHESWNLLRGLAGESSLPWCVVGDFIDMMFAQEKIGGRPHSRVLLDGFKETINDCGLMDMGFIGNEFTRERSRGHHNWLHERLDRGLANLSWQNMFPDAQVRVCNVSTSDHLPLVVELNKQVYVPKGQRFRFENIWIKEADCYNLINES